MVEMDQVRELTERIVQHFQPERIILFGSYARGAPGEDSDVDLLVVMPFEGRSLGKALEILNAAKPCFALDLIVRTPEHLQERLAQGDFFLREVTEKGTVLYEASHR
jgi:predicted nucleotidyltransferase